jgi:hypothetical protein
LNFGSSGASSSSGCADLVEIELKQWKLDFEETKKSAQKMANSCSKLSAESKQLQMSLAHEGQENKLSANLAEEVSQRLATFDKSLAEFSETIVKGGHGRNEEEAVAATSTLEKASETQQVHLQAFTTYIKKVKQFLL